MAVFRQNFTPQSTGSSQHSRLSLKLLPEYFKVDERDTASFLAFISEYARMFPFEDPHGKVEGKQWDVFFDRNVAVILATVISTDVDQIDREFEFGVQKVLSAYDPQDKLIAFEELFGFIISKAKLLPSWHKRLLHLNGMSGTVENDAEIELWTIIDQKLRKALVTLNAIIQQARKLGLLIHYQEFPFKEYGFSKIPPHFQRVFKGETSNSQLDFAMIELRGVYDIIFNSLLYAKTKVVPLFESAMHEKSDHTPEVSLFISFLEIFKYAQNDLNELTLRHLEYYYRSILLQDFRPPISDSVHLCFKLAQNSFSCQLPKGTMLLAGRNDMGREITFATAEDVELNKASIASLKSVYISRVLEGQTWTYKLVTGLYAAPVANSSDGRGGSFYGNQNDWPLFGEEQYKAGRVTMQYADLGFAISSPMLLLSEGKRKVKIHLNFNEDQETQGTYKKLIEDLKTGSTDEDLQNALFDVFGRGRDFAFKVMISTVEGWIDVADVSSNTLFVESKPWSWNSITIGFTIPASCPPIVAINPEIMTNDGYSTRFPTIKFLLNPEKTPFVYTFLETLRFDVIDIETTVEKMKSIVVYNDLGKVESSQPFQPLGSIPQIGSFCLLGNAEWFQKKVDYLNLHLEWQNLPSNGLREYYKEYFETDIEIDESKFKVHLSALSGYEFKPALEDDILEYQLFPKDATTMHSWIELEETNRLNIRPNPDMAPVDHFDNHTRIGFLRLELKEPKLGFGHSLFQERMAEIAQHNANMEEVEKKRFPNPPFSPLLKSVDASYRASDRIVLEQYDPTSRNEIYHIHPFGVVPIFTKGTLHAKSAAIIPDYNEDGYLYIGLRDLQPPQEVSLLFELSAGRNTFTAQLPAIKWSFLTSSGWEDLKTIDLLSDTTDNFTKTGIVRLRIPGEATGSNPVLPTGVHYLRVSVRGSVDNISRALDVRAQAVRAEWVQDPDIDFERLREPLPAYTISRTFSSVANLREVLQPYGSFNARPKELRSEFFQRISERLRHKNRAVTHWDYERMILNQYHTIAQVKCLSHITNPVYVLQGDLRIVVIPGRNQSTEILTPKVNHGTLYDIQNYLRDHSSIFANLRVSNPTYEYVRVNCRVKFTDRKNNGESLEKLRKDIRKFICPWQESSTSEIEIGGSLKVEDLYRFIKSLSYVDFVTKFAVLHFFIEDEETGVYKLKSSADPRLSDEERSYIRSNKPWSVLIPDQDHEIEFTEREHHVAPDFNLEPVDFQGKFQISPHLIKILPKEEEVPDNGDIRYDQEETIRIFVDVPD